MTLSLTICEGSQESTTPTRIGAGSFATVFAAPGRPIAIKVAHNRDHAAQVEWEFASLQAVLAAAQNNAYALFMVPRPLAYYDPQTSKLLFPSSSSSSVSTAGSPDSAQGALSAGRRDLPHLRPFNPEFFDGLPPRPCYAMDRAAPLPPHIARRVRTHFYPAAAASNVPVPLICRLYFGKDLSMSMSARPSAFVNPANFPLDAARYDLLRDGDEDMPPQEEVAEGMGEMLAVIHWRAAYDARDVEFVMAGATHSAGVHLYVIDFNQWWGASVIAERTSFILWMRAFDRDAGDVLELVDAFFINDPYYPRPVLGEALYEDFKRGYLNACPENLWERAALFLQKIEARQAEKRPSARETN